MLLTTAESIYLIISLIVVSALSGAALFGLWLLREQTKAQARPPILDAFPETYTAPAQEERTPDAYMVWWHDREHGWQGEPRQSGVESLALMSERIAAGADDVRRDPMIYVDIKKAA